MEIKINNVYCSDWIVFMEMMRDQNIFVNTSATSPPYWQLRDYEKHPDQLGKERDVDEYIQHLVEGYHLLQQVLSPDGSFFLNIGDSYAYKELQMIPARVALALKKDGWILRNQIIWLKCIGENTKLYALRDGIPVFTKAHELLRTNSVLELPGIDEKFNFKWAKVVYKHKLKSKDTKTMKFQDGNKVWVTGNHKWAVMNQSKTRYRLRTTDSMMTNEPKHRTEYFPSLIYFPLPTVFKNTIFNYDMGYIIGLYVAEGSMQKSKKSEVRFTLGIGDGFIDDLIKKLEIFGENINNYIYNNTNIITIYSLTLKGIIKKFVIGENALSKSFTQDVLLYGTDFIRGILDGYLDGDGYWDEENKRWRLGFGFNTNLEDWLRLFSKILGYRIRTQHYKVKYQNGIKQAIRGTIHFNRENIKAKKTINDCEFVRLKSIRKNEKEHNVWDINIDSDTHLFALGSGILTHNSNPEPSSVKDRWANTYELVYFFTKKNTKGPFWWIRLNRPNPYDREGRKKKSYEKLVEKQKIWDETVEWWGNSVIKPYDEVPERFRIVGYKLSYYFALDLIRKPHKIASLEKYQRQVNVGLGGANRKSKHLKAGKQLNLGGRAGVPRWFLDSYGKDKNYSGKFDDLQQQTLVAETDPRKVGEEILNTPDLRQLQFDKKWRHKSKHRSASQQQRLEMYHPKGATPKDVIKSEESETKKVKTKKINLFSFCKDEEQESSEEPQKKPRPHARRGGTPSKFDGQHRGGMILPPHDPNEWVNPKGKNPGDAIKMKGYDEYYEATHIPATVKSKGHGDKASTIARLAAGEVENHPLGKNPGDVLREIEIPLDLFEFFLEWVEWQNFSADVFELSTRGYKGSHFAVFPKSLVHDPILVTCPPNGIAFDPMCGRGTVGKVAWDLGLNYLLCDLVPKYVKIAKEYIGAGQRRLI